MLENNNIPLDYYDSMYHDRNLNQRTSLSSAFFSLSNLQTLTMKMSQELSRRFHVNVIFPNDDEYYAYLENLVKTKPHMLNVQEELMLLNVEVLQDQVKEKSLGLRQKQLFNKWFIQQNRPFVIEPPMSSQGRHQDISPSYVGYHYDDPKRKFFADWLAKQHLL